MDYFKYSANSIMARNMFLMYKNTGHEFYMDIYKKQKGQNYQLLI